MDAVSRSKASGHCGWLMASQPKNALLATNIDMTVMVLVLYFFSVFLNFIRKSAFFFV